MLNCQLKVMPPLMDTFPIVMIGSRVNTHPVLLLTLTDVGPAYQVAPPVAFESFMDKALPYTTPLDLLIVAAVPDVDEVI